jgi:hypothetical protein
MVRGPLNSTRPWLSSCCWLNSGKNRCQIWHNNLYFTQ